MKTRRKKHFAACMVFLLFSMLLMPLRALAEGTEIPKGYVDPVSTLGMKTGDVDSFWEFWERLEEIYLVPYEAHVAYFDSFLDRAEGRRFYPVSGAPLVIKRGAVIPEYRLDLSYGPVQYTLVDSTITAEVSGEYLMKNIQFGTTEAKAILHNVGGSVAVMDDFGSTPSTYSVDLVESIDYGNQYRLPEASYAAAAVIDADNPTTLRLWSEGKQRGDDGGVDRVMMVNFRVAGVKLSAKGAAAVNKEAGTVNTRAAKDKGETGVSIPEALAIVIIGGAAAMAGAGGRGDKGDNTSKKKSRYKMCLKKDFGDAIRYDAQPVTVYARIVEVTPEGEEIDRPDLTPSLEIFSGGNLAVEGSSMADNYMGALVSAESVPGGENPGTGILSIRFSGEEGSFQNNVTFRLIGDPYISLDKPYLSLLVGSGEKFVMPIEFVDFAEPPTNIMLDGDPLPITVEQDEEGNYYLAVVDDTPKSENIVSFYEEVPYTISANSGEETIRASFTVLKCYEGLLVDFLGKENEIMAYKNQEGEMPVTNVGFQLGLWNKEQSRLELTAPAGLEIAYKDKEGIYDLIGLIFEHNTDLSTSEHTVYSFTAKKSLPSPDKIEGTLSYSTQIGDIRMENKATIYLIPDLLTYAKDFEQEFKNCERIIFTYMSGELMKRKADELYRDKNRLGLEDLKLFRKHCWEIASRMILQEKEDYMQKVYWHDEVIATLEFTVFIGDAAFAIALTPLGGPITAFLVDNVKSTFLELCEEYVKKGDAFTWDTLQEIIWNRFKQTIGSVDNFIGMPEDASWKVKTAWLCSYFLYRVFYHWYFDEDEDGNSLGLVAALENATLDFGVNRITALFGDYVKEVGKKDGIDFSQRIKAEEDAVETALVGAFDMADKGAALLDNSVEVIVDFIKSIQLV